MSGFEYIILMSIFAIIPSLILLYIFRDRIKFKILGISLLILFIIGVIWDQLSFEPIYLDTLAEKISQPTGSILNTLLSLEIKGLIKQLPGMMFVKNFE